MAASLLNSGVTAFRIPVSNGEPWVISDGYSLRSWSRSLLDIPEM